MRVCLCVRAIERVSSVHSDKVRFVMGRARGSVRDEEGTLDDNFSLSVAPSCVCHDSRDSFSLFLSRALSLQHFALLYHSLVPFSWKKTKGRRNLPAASTATTIAGKVTSVSTFIASVFTSSEEWIV
jgi:hypothetical protein